MSHPHPNPLPSRERGCGSREAGGHVGPPLRRLSRRACLFLASRERGCLEPGSGRTHGSAPTAVESPQRLSVSRVEGEGGGGGLFVADYVYDELLGGGDPVVGLEAVGPVLHYVVEELDDGDAVGGLGSDEPGHEEFVYPREDGEEVSRQGGGAFRVTATRLLSSTGQGSAGSGRPLMEWPRRGRLCTWR